MARPVSEIVAAIEDFKPLNGNWLGLDALLEELFRSGSASAGVDAMLHVFERYPKEDGAGVFWGIVHGLESLPGYEGRLIESITKAPSGFALIMVNRLLNGGRAKVAGIDLLALLEQVAVDEKVAPETRLEAAKYLNWHKKR